MSAFMVDDQTIDAIISGAFAFSLPYLGHGVFRYNDAPMPMFTEAFISGQPWGDIRNIQQWINEHRHDVRIDEADRLGAILLAENRRSVDFRYAESEIEDFYTFTRIRDLNPWFVLRCIGTYTYQACEHPEWPNSTAFQIVDTVRDNTIGWLMERHATERITLNPEFMSDLLYMGGRTEE